MTSNSERAGGAGDSSAYRSPTLRAGGVVFGCYVLGVACGYALGSWWL